MLHPNAAPGERELISIEITTEPSKMSYTVGETFDPTGMVVTGNYSDETTEEITDYTYEPTEALTLEDTTVVVSYDGNTASLPITVTEE